MSLNTSIQEYIIESLNFSMHNHTSLGELSSFILRMCLRLVSSRNSPIMDTEPSSSDDNNPTHTPHQRGYVATSDPLDEANMQYTAVWNLPLNVGQSFQYQKNKTLYVPPGRKARWLIFPLIYQNKTCGVVGLENHTNLDNMRLREIIRPFLPMCVSNMIGGHLLSLRVQHSHDLFLSTMSHEIRTPLNGIVVATHLLQEGESHRSEDNLRIIAECSHQLVDIINDILDFTKIRCGRMKLNETVFSVREMLNEVYDVISLKAHEKKLNVLIELNPNVPSTVVGDKKRIRQILLNLLSNSIKFTERGQIDVRIAKQEIQGQKSADWVVLDMEVEDTGVGIPPEHFETIFESFKTLPDKSDAYVHKDGTGLGLAICRTLCRMMRGDIRVKHSQPYRGTCMAVQIHVKIPPPYPSPSAAQAVPDVSPKQPSTNFMFSPEKNMALLIVGGPDHTARLRVAQWVREWGYHPVLCSTLDEVRFYADQPHFRDRVLLMDRSWSSTLSSLEKEGRLIVADPLPEKKSLKQALQHPSPPTQHGHQSMYVLVVEDNENNLRVVQRLLRFLNYNMERVEYARCGREAVQKAKEHKYDVIFMDLKLPDISGIAATREILQFYASRCPDHLKPQFHRLLHLQPVVVAMTACVMDMDKEKCKKVGMRGFLNKPLIMDEVELMMRIIWEKREKARLKYT